MELETGLKFVVVILTAAVLCSSVYIVVGQESRFTSSKTIQSHGTIVYLDRTHSGEVSQQVNDFDTVNSCSARTVPELSFA